MSNGPKENAVRATRATRPSGILDDLGEAERCFTALFHGCSQRAYVTSGGSACFGKAECEWGWPHDWEKLREAGLIDFKAEREDTPHMIGGYVTNISWSITPKGWDVREDDLAWFNALMDARREDEAASRASSSKGDGR